METNGTIAVIGATGYIGARLVPRLLQAGYRVKAISRSLEKLSGYNWANHPNVELVAANVLDTPSLRRAFEDCDIAYYLVHSMNPHSKDFSESDRQGALNMVAAADTSSLSRIIYLGGLGDRKDKLSKHLRSRAEVADILQTGRVPVTVLRAAMIIGSGSASFEILRYLVDRLPYMITPRWVRTPSQPIAVRNVLAYLIGLLDHPETTGKRYDIGGPDVVTYQQLMDIYAEESKLSKRKVLPVPYFTPGLSSYWIHFVTPVPAYIARPLADGLRNRAVCRETRIRKIIPQDLLDCRTAIRLAIARYQHQRVESHWTDAGAVPPAEWFQAEDPAWAGGTVFVDRRSTVVRSTVGDVWNRIIKLGGENGYYYGDWLWNLRGLMDRAVGGVGLMRGRRNNSQLRTGDALDFWRVAAIEDQKRLLLIAEMKVPGKAMLEFRIEPVGTDQVHIMQTAKFLPQGLAGIFYWYAVSPLHNFVFDGMLKGIANWPEKSNRRNDVRV